MKTNFTSSFEVQVYEVLSCYKIALFWLFVQRFCNLVGSHWSILVSSSLHENLLRKFCKRDKNYQLNNVVAKVITYPMFDLDSMLRTDDTRYLIP